MTQAEQPQSTGPAAGETEQPKDKYERRADAERAIDANARRIMERVAPPGLTYTLGLSADGRVERYGDRNNDYLARPDVRLSVFVPHDFDEEPRDLVRNMVKAIKSPEVGDGNDYVNDHNIDAARTVRVMPNESFMMLHVRDDSDEYQGTRHQSLEFSLLSTRRQHGHGMLQQLEMATYSPEETDAVILQQCETLAGALGEAADRLEAAHAPA